MLFMWSILVIVVIIIIIIIIMMPGRSLRVQANLRVFAVILYIMHHISYSTSMFVYIYVVVK